MNIVHKERLENLALMPEVYLQPFIDHVELILKNGLSLPMHYQTALVLSLFNGKRKLEHIEKIVEELFKVKFEEAVTYVESIVYRFNPFFINEKYPESNTNCSIESKLFLPKNIEYILPMQYPAPIVMNFNITFNCNRKCIYCYMDALHSFKVEDDIIEKERFLQIINEAGDLGVSKMVFIGGEPFLREDLIELLELCSMRRIYTQVTTKYCIGEKLMKRLANLDFFELYLSYDINNENVCNELSGDPVLYSEIDKTMRLALANNIKVTLAPIFCSVNAEKFMEFIKYALDLGVQEVFVSRYFKSIGRHSDKYVVTQEQWENIKEQCKELSDKVKFNDENTNPVRDTWKIEEMEDGKHNPTKCAQGRTDMTILPDGKVSYCGFLIRMDEYLTYGDLKKESILSAWRSSKLQRVINPNRELYKGMPCYSCSTFDNCPYRMKCINCSYVEKGTFFAPSAEGEFYCDKYK